MVKIPGIMAIYHFAAQAISRSAGRSATAAAAYRAGEKIHDERTGQTFNYGKKSGVEHTEIMAPANAPEWAHDRAKLWNAVEQAEKRKDSQVCREVEVSLPVELSHEDQCELVRGFVQKHFVDSGMVADIAIHRPKRENPHAHILLTMRDISPEGFSQKNRNWNDKQLLEKWREQWAEHTNRALKRAGQSARVDHRTLEAQGIDRVPQIHIGAKTPEMEARGIRTDRATLALEIEVKNEQLRGLQADMEAIRNERDYEDSPSPQPRADSRGIGAVGNVAGDTRRPSASQHQGAGRSQPETSTGMEQPAGERSLHCAASSAASGRTGGIAQKGHGQAASGSGGNRAGTARPALATGGIAGNGGHPRGGAGDRIRALAGSNPDGAEPPKPQGVGRVPETRNSGRAQTPMKPDRSYLAARRQLAAMGAETFEIGIRDQEGKMLIRTWSTAKVLESLPWLKRENAKGSDVYVRPAGEANAGLVLVDDLNRGALARMQADGLAPAAVTETSPDNFQAWVRVHDKPIPPELATEVAADLASAYGGDPNSADWRHFGRLAGLTNAKPKHKDANGRSPYVLAHESSGKVAERGRQVLAVAAQRVIDRVAVADRKGRMEAIQTATEPPKGRNPIQTYRYGLKALYSRFGKDMDVSKADFMIGVDMARKGFSPDQIGGAIEQASPELPTRKAGHEADYVARTVKAVFTHPEVVKHQQEQTKEAAQQRSSRRERDIGPSLG